MSVQSEKHFLIDLLQNINDSVVIEKVKNFLLAEINESSLSVKQKSELDKRIAEHNQNPNSGIDAFDFLDSLKSKYEL
jgi:hypothetical protein